VGAGAGGVGRRVSGLLLGRGGLVRQALGFQPGEMVDRVGAALFDLIADLVAEAVVALQEHESGVAGFDLPLKRFGDAHQCLPHCRDRGWRIEHTCKAAGWS